MHVLRNLKNAACSILETVQMHQTWTLEIAEGTGS